MPGRCLPCFNSNVIEHFLYNIPGLSEQFLYANDDMLFYHPVTPETFFASDGLPIIRFSRRAFKKLSFWIRINIKRKPLTNYKQNIHNAARLIEGKYGVYYNSRTHHNIDAYLKSEFQHAREAKKGTATE